jgi:hypothetical protein
MFLACLLKQSAPENSENPASGPTEFKGQNPEAVQLENQDVPAFYLRSGSHVNQNHYI